MASQVPKLSTVGILEFNIKPQSKLFHSKKVKLERVGLEIININ